MKYITINYIKKSKYDIKIDKTFHVTHLHCKLLTQGDAYDVPVLTILNIILQLLVKN